MQEVGGRRDRAFLLLPTPGIQTFARTSKTPEAKHGPYGHIILILIAVTGEKIVKRSETRVNFVANRSTQLMLQNWKPRPIAKSKN
jgi:hypothetical protein